MKKYNAIRLLSLFVLGASIIFSAQQSYAALATPTTINSITVNANDSIDVVCTDPTFDAGEIIEGRELILDEDPLFGTPEVTVGGPLDMVALTCDGLTINNVSFTGNYNDFDVVNVRLTIYDDNNLDSFDTDSFIVADNTDPVVTGSTTNIVNGGSTVKTILDQYVESCTSTDNDPAYVDSCAVQSGGIDTSVLGLQSVTYFATDAAGNTGTDTVTTTVVAGNAPVITLNGANPEVYVLNAPYVEAGATASDVEDGDLTGSIIIDSSAVDTSTVGSYIVTYDVTDSSGNTDHEERTVNVILGNAPVITVLGNDGIFLPYGFPSYSDDGATCSDVEDGVIPVGPNFVTTGLPVNTAIPQTNQITYTCTDSSGNVSTAFRSVTVGEPRRSSSCSGDCEAPTLGLSKSGERVVDNGITVKTPQYTWTKDAVPFFTAMEKLTANVGDMITVKTKIYDNSGKDNIRHAELGIGAKEIGDKNANARIEVDRSFDGVISVKVVDPNFILTDPITGMRVADADWDSTNCKSSTPNAKDCAEVTYTFVVRAPIKDYVLVTDVWDSYRYSQVTWFNHGIAFEGDSLNPLPNHYVMNARHHIVNIIEDEYMGDTAHDADGNLYNLVDGLWIQVVDRPENLQTQLDKINREIEALRAADHFDSNTIQGKLESSKLYDYPSYGRGHDPVPNMRNAFVDYMLSKPGTVNHSSYSLD